MSELPSGWSPVTLGEIAEESRVRFDPTSSAPPQPYVGLEHLIPGDVRTRLFGTSEEVDSLKTQFRPGDVLFGKLRPYLRKVALADRAGVCSTDILAVRPGTKVLSEYLLGVLSREETFAHATASSAGTKMPRTSWAQMSTMPIPLPPLTEQKKIAAILSSVDEAIRANDAVIEQTRRAKEGLLQELLSPQLEPSRRSAAWVEVAVGSVAEVVRGSSPRPAGDPRYFNGADVPWITVGLLAQDERPYLDATPTYLTHEGAKFSRLLPAGTVVISNSGFGCGVPKVLRISGCANDGIAAFLNLSRTVEPLYLYYWLRSMTLTLRHKIARGVDQPNLNTSLIRDLRMPVPPLDEQRAICRRMEGFDASIDAGLATIHQARRVKAGLLQDLLTGKVRVTP